MELVAKKDGIKWKCVPYPGAAPAITALLGNHADFFAGGGISANLKLIETGQLRLIAILNPKRFDRFPNIPALKEMGYDPIAAPSIGILGPPPPGSADRKEKEIGKGIPGSNVGWRIPRCSAAFPPFE